MVQTKQKHRAPKPKTFQPVYQERTSPFIPEAISLHKEDQAVEEKQSYAMVTGLLQVLVHIQIPGIGRPPANLFTRHKVASIAYQRYVRRALGLCSHKLTLLTESSSRNRVSSRDYPRQPMTLTNKPALALTQPAAMMRWHLLQLHWHNEINL